MVSVSIAQFLSIPYAYFSSGDIIYISVGGQGVLILNSFKVAADLLDRRAGIYSSRMRTIGELSFLLFSDNTY